MSEAQEASEEKLASTTDPSHSKCATDRTSVKSDLENKSNQLSSCSRHIDGQLSKCKSASRDSSVNDDPKSLVDSLSAASGRQMWSSKDLAEDEPSICSIKGDSISATIADYDRKHRAQTSSDNQSKTSVRLLVSESASRNGSSSVNINFYPAGSSTSGIAGPSAATNLGSRGDLASTALSQNNVADSFDVIEESGNLSSVNAPEQARNPKSKRTRDIKRNVRRSNHGRRNHQSSTRDNSLDIDDLPQPSAYSAEPVVIRGNGNLTLFGLSNSFNSEFPSSLIGRVSKEEFNQTMQQINRVLNDHQSMSAKILLIGSLFCCCSLGFSVVWPSIALKKRSKLSLEKFLACENNRLYSKLGLNWKLAEQRCYSNHAFVEYVLMIEFMPKINLYLPD